MEKEKFIECERKNLQVLINFRLPAYFYKIGMLVIGASLIARFVRAFALEGDTQWLKLLLQNTLVGGMLLLSVARDKQEDEMLISLRAQSYTIAFVIGVVYALVMPYVEFGVSNVVHSGGEDYKDLGDFQILLFMLMIQLMFFHNLKRFR
jgi:hypothetical protein